MSIPILNSSVNSLSLICVSLKSPDIVYDSKSSMSPTSFLRRRKEDKESRHEKVKKVDMDKQKTK